MYGVMAKRVLVLGAGVAGLEAALALQALGEGRVTVELVSPDSEFVYRPLAVAEPFRLAEARRFPVAHLAEAAGASLTVASALRVDPDRKTVETSAGEIDYDVLLLALGAKPLVAVPGAVTFRGLETRRRSKPCSATRKRVAPTGWSSRCRPGCRGRFPSTSSLC